MTPYRLGKLLALVIVGLCEARPVLAADEPLPDKDVIMRALVDELGRTMKLQMEDLEKPYFVEFDVADTSSYQIVAAYGAITRSDHSRMRTFSSQVRVGSMELDNTNFVEGGGGRGGRPRTELPIGDDYVALRQAIWRAADADYKNAVETLTRKRAYMRDKNIADRPNDFSPAAKVEQGEPSAVLRVDPSACETNLRRISAQLKKYEQVRDSDAQLQVWAANNYVVNSEGSGLRTADEGAVLVVRVEVQAEDGMTLSDALRYAGATAADLPPVEQVLKDVGALVVQLTAAAKAPVLESYTGPVLFDDLTAAQLFRSVLVGGLAARPDPVGERRRAAQGSESLENKLGTRILPKTFQVWDDPTATRQGDDVLLGHYRFDDEGVPAARVGLVTDGKLEGLCLSRAPTKKLSGSNGHGRRTRGVSESAIGCLFIHDTAAVPDAELKAALIAAAKDAGLEYGVRIKSIRSGTMRSPPSDMLPPVGRRQRGGGVGAVRVGDPVLAYKVYVADGHEEPIRGFEIASLELSSLKKIIAAGDRPCVFNYVGLSLGGAAGLSSIVAPPVLFEELELSKIQQEQDKPPILKAPAFR